MATRTCSQTGNTSSTATWGGAAKPGAADSVIISNDRVVTINENTIWGSISKMGDSGDVFIGGILVANGVTFTVLGNISPENNSYIKPVSGATCTLKLGGSIIPVSDFAFYLFTYNDNDDTGIMTVSPLYTAADVGGGSGGGRMGIGL